MNGRPYLFLHEAAQRLHLTLDECRTLMEWGCFPIGRQVEGTCIVFYAAAEIESFGADIATGGTLYGRVQYLFERNSEF